jgi:hypothetical protein
MLSKKKAYQRRCTGRGLTYVMCVVYIVTEIEEFVNVQRNCKQLILQI